MINNDQPTQMLPLDDQVHILADQSDPYKGLNTIAHVENYTSSMMTDSNDRTIRITEVAEGPLGNRLENTRPPITHTKDDFAVPELDSILEDEVPPRMGGGDLGRKPINETPPEQDDCEINP